MNIPDKLPCDGFNVSFDDFCLEKSPCRKCDFDVCPFSLMLNKLSDTLEQIGEKLGYFERED